MSRPDLPDYSLQGLLDNLKLYANNASRLAVATGGQNSLKKRSLLDLPAEIWSKIGGHAIEAEDDYCPRAAALKARSSYIVG
ncbi:uncharacterized protein CLAFUR5_12558 [Fulvia fulva]|uniref:Uncharacterized protein n=1 Tax=Passalora fulva TaxID=5499 RepID=A0A9Q8PJ13_PASFU|nr:uncharacterized protein CLAFUR5_12558 [Fulvia fulva]KAK4612742.1 hypothetical protein CLAFUR0_12704 [Fulvia fulva]UJO23549.1 hypothetical protein CLAFUR5_12558 [Fulvia fulva]WPV36112.1 hypothetical protein CLAFUW7_12700 [Fulvia fulva]